ADQLLLHSMDFKLDPVRLDTLLTCLPDSVRQSMPLLRQLQTDAAVGLDMHLTKPFNTLTDSIPHAEVNLIMEPCKLNLGRSRMHDVEARIHATLRGNDLSASTVNIERMHVAGPATRLTLSGDISDLGPDPYFDGQLEGFSDLKRLPDALMNLLAGSIQGSLRMDMKLSGRPSMFGRDRFHLLRASGELHGSELYWLANDTIRAAYARKIDFDFGTQKSTARADSLLHAVVKIDTISFLDHDTDVRATGLVLGVGAENNSSISDTTVITPMGGGLTVASLRVQSIVDSVGMVARKLGGRIVMRRFEGHTRRPEFRLDMGVGRIGVGSPDARFLISQASIKADAHLKPRSEHSKRIRRTADSLRTVHPELPLDSVYMLALEMHRRRGKHKPRVHPEMTQSDREIIEWGTSRGLARLLTGWVLQGTVTAKRAGMYAAAFPLRNRVRNLNIRFNTDSILINDVQYKVGHSDFTINGRITNMSRALTSKTGRQPLRINLELISDTIDVNQLAAATFSGAAYSQNKARKMAHSLRSLDLDADTINLDRMLSHAADTLTGPLLVPSNIEAELHMRANHIIYSDLLLHKFYGDALMANGHLNFNRLHAASELGSIDLNALYSAPTPDDMQFGFGLVLKDFNIERFLHLVPAIDSLMPLMRDISGIVDADIAATVDVDSNMDLKLPTLNAAVRLKGDSLRLLDGKTFDNLAKWLLFKDKKHNQIDSMSVELLIEDGMMEIFPFVFNFDRYRLGIQGYNDMALNFNYKIAVLKSPIPFKFGIPIKGNPDKYSVRFGRARFNEKTAIERPAIVDTTRVNLLRQIEGVFRRGVAGSRMKPLRFDIRPQAQTIDLNTDTLSRADSLLLQREGLIPAQ
ncbi:MAG: AsmA-like C-terminal region-containing protein, partial [Muribaculaceae bacterium]|nr:AsmA-like C-terminal region-containing protein [Muribaculaceae bacterium]